LIRIAAQSPSNAASAVSKRLKRLGKKNLILAEWMFLSTHLGYFIYRFGLQKFIRNKNNMTIQEQIKKDLMQAMKEKDEEKKSALRVTIGEFGRGEKKEITDEEAVKVIRKLIKSERETLEQSGKQGDNHYIEILEYYLPKIATDDEITQWIRENINFSDYKNKMQAMRDIMTHFGSSADGNRIKEILQKI
jgi:uncharacterized protein